MSPAVEKPTAELLVIHGVEIHRDHFRSKLEELGVSTWSKVEGSPGFTLHPQVEGSPGFTLHPQVGKRSEQVPVDVQVEGDLNLLEGRVIVQVEGQEGSFEIGGGDLAVFPKGMKIVWDVVEPVNKHYSLLEEVEENTQSS